MITLLLASSWLTIWLWAEMVVMISPLLYRSSSGQESKESGVKYIIIQMPGTILVLLALCRPSWLALWCLIVALILKLGIVPLHTWVLRVLPKVRFRLLFFFRTLAKLPTLCLIVESLWLYCLGLVNVLLGVVGGIVSSDIKLLLSYSRIINTGWLVVLTAHSLKWVAYFCLYQLTLLILINYCLTTARGSRQIRVNLTPERSIILIMLILSLAGSPPLLGFWYKWVLIITLGAVSRLIMIILRVLLVLAVYFYLQISTLPMLSTSLLKGRPRTNKLTYLTLALSIIGGLGVRI